MRLKKLPLVALLAMAAVSAIAQSPPLIEPSGARPGHIPGVGESLPKSNAASNILTGKATTDIAPTLPDPTLPDSAGPYDYLRSARAAVVAGQTGLAQQSLEMAETRALDRVISPGQPTAPTESRFVAKIHDARLALGGGDSAGAILMIDLALAN